MAEVLAKDLKTGQYMHLAPRKSCICNLVEISVECLPKEQTENRQAEKDKRCLNSD